MVELQKEIWISAKEASARYAKQAGGIRIFKEMVAEAIRDGLLRVRAGVIFESEAVGVTAAMKDGPSKPSAEPAEVTPGHFQRSKRWPSDTNYWQWPYNKFVITTKIKPIRRFVFKHVELLESDLVEIIPGEIKTQSSRKGIGGRPVRVEDYTRFWLALINVLHDKPLVDGAYRSQSDLIKDIISEDKGMTLSQTIIKSLVSQLWKKRISGRSETQFPTETD